MIVVMQHWAGQRETEAVLERLSKEGFQVHLSQGVKRTIIGVIGENTKMRLASLGIEAMPGVEKVVPILHPFKLAGCEFKPERTLIQVGDVTIGGKELQIIAGPCAVESEELLIEIARQVKEAGATFLRGGAFKPGFPYSFQGLEETGLKYLARAREITGLKIVTEVIDAQHVPLVASYADILQVGLATCKTSNSLKLWVRRSVRFY